MFNQKTCKFSKSSKPIYTKPIKLIEKNFVTKKKTAQFNKKENFCKTIAEDKDEGFLSSQSARDCKIYENLKIDENMFRHLFKNDDIQFDYSYSMSKSNIKENNKSNFSNSNTDVFTGIGMCKNRQLSRNLNPSKFYESPSSNFLNLNLGESKNLTYMLEHEHELEINENNLNKDNDENSSCHTKLTNTKRDVTVADLEANANIQDSSSSAFEESANNEDSETDNETEKNEKMKNDLSISKISLRNFSSSRIMSNNMLFNEKPSRVNSYNNVALFNRNISVLSSELALSLFDDPEKDFGYGLTYYIEEVNSDYCSDTDEFNEKYAEVFTDISNKSLHNVPYKMNTHDNFLKSHLDILNLNFILRCLFHKSEILSEKTSENKNYIKRLAKIFEDDDVIITENDKKITRRQNSGTQGRRGKKATTTKENNYKISRMKRNQTLSLYRSISSQIRMLQNAAFVCE